MENLKIINQNNLINNLMCFKQKKVCAMVKANAYGHGLEKVVEILQGKVDYFGVANVSEAQRARHVTDKPILICSKVQELKTCKKNNFEVIVENEEELEKCIQFGLEKSCHLKINSGMNRFGVKGDLNLRLLNEYIHAKGINLRAVHTHFSDTNNFKHTVKEYKNFIKLNSELSHSTPICFGGSGVIKYPFKFDMIRVGIGLYGYGDKRLLPVMKIESYVMKVFYAKRGEFIGYSKNFRVKNAGFFAVIAMGYADGIQRRLSGKFKYFPQSKNDKIYRITKKV